MINPKVFISYSWESSVHKNWVKALAARLRSEGIETILDQWELIPGDQLTVFMEQSIRKCNFVLIICTPKYKDKSDKREGGVGYEGDIMTAEVAQKNDRRKFIPLLRSISWDAAAPTWLSGSYYIDLCGDPYSDESYFELVNTLLDRREKPPIISKIETKEDEISISPIESEIDIPSPFMAYMHARAWIAEKKLKFPVAVDFSKVGWYPELTKSGGGFFYDEVLEYRVWIHPKSGGPGLEYGEGDDYFCAFPSYEEAVVFSKEIPGAEDPLVLVLQKEHINEPETGKFIHVIGDRITEWNVAWLKDGKREPNTISDFLLSHNC